MRVLISPRFVTDCQASLDCMEGCFLELAECQHILETAGKTAEFLELGKKQ